MKVALLRVYKEERWHSIDVYADRLAQGLRRLYPDIHIVEVQLPAWSWSDWRLSLPFGRSASLHTLGLYLSRWIRYPLTLRLVQADLYHILDNSYGHLAFFLDPRRTLVTSHGGAPKAWRRWNPEGPSMWLFDLAFRGALRAGHIIIVSEYARQELLSEARYPAEYIHVIHHGVDEQFLSHTADGRQQVRDQYMRPGDTALVLHVGHCAARKNVETALRAVGRLRQRGVAVRFVQVGGVFTPGQRRLVEELKIGAGVTQISYIPNAQLPALYAAADVFIFPSFYEGFGIPLIEAMACGAPVVCSDSALFREVCGDAALFADPRNPDAFAERIANVLSDPALARDLCQRGRERAHCFTWERTVQQTVAVYQKMLEDLA